jgi:hypothetical protein
MEKSSEELVEEGKGGGGGCNARELGASSFIDALFKDIFILMPVGFR